jgi:hypothetical protein
MYTPPMHNHCHHLIATVADYPTDNRQWLQDGHETDLDESFVAVFDGSSFDSTVGLSHALPDFETCFGCGLWLFIVGYFCFGSGENFDDPGFLEGDCVDVVAKSLKLDGICW